MTGIKGQNSVNSVQPTFEEPEEDTVKVGLEDFSFLQVLGKGSFGKVRHTGRPANSHAFSVKLVQMPLFSHADATQSFSHAVKSTLKRKQEQFS